jgi:hypothetical protein
MEQIVADCREFQAGNGEDIAKGSGGRGFDGETFTAIERAGHDFWLTRNGHGAGFWDGDWPEDVGERLTAASKTFGECFLYVGDDGRIHL